MLSTVTEASQYSQDIDIFSPLVQMKLKLSEVVLFVSSVPSNKGQGQGLNQVFA